MITNRGVARETTSRWRRLEECEMIERMTTQTIPASHHDLVTGTTVGLSTINDDGSIQTTAIWVLLDDDGVLRTSLAKNRVKFDNLVARPQGTLFAISPTNPFHTLEVRADVEIAEDVDHSFMAKLIATYGQTLESMAEQVAEARTIVTFNPTRVRAQG
jgi:PPOX class probable F420-dependent enzyme